MLSFYCVIGSVPCTSADMYYLLLEIKYFTICFLSRETGLTTEGKRFLYAHTMKSEDLNPNLFDSYFTGKLTKNAF